MTKRGYQRYRPPGGETQIASIIAGIGGRIKETRNI